MRILFVGPITPPLHGQSIAFAKVFDSVNCDDFKLLVNTNSKNNNTLSLILLNIKNIFLMFRYVFFERIEVVYFTCSRSFYGSIKDVILITVANLMSIRIVNHLHGSDFYDFIHSSNILYKSLLLRVYKNVDTSIILLDSMKDQFQDFPEMKIEIVPNFYDKSLDLIDYNKNDDSFNVLYLSNIIKSKGIFELIDAFIIFSKENSNAYLNIAGDFFSDKYMSSREVKILFFEKIKNNSKITYHGVVDGKCKMQLLHMSDVFVLPSYYASEAFPISIVEAMRCGNAIVVSDYQYLPEIIPPSCGFLVKQRSSIDIVEKLKILTNKAILSGIQKNNVMLAKSKYSQLAYTKKINNILNHLRMTTILGINAYHGDSSACLVRGGKLIAAVEEERFRRIKHWAGFPSKAAEYCLLEAGIQLSDLDHVAINQDSKANLWKKIGYTLSNRPDIRMVIGRAKHKRKRSNVQEELSTSLNMHFDGKVHEVEHHYAHLSSAFHVSPFEDAVLVSVDGFGDFTSAAWGTGHGSKISIDDRVYFPHSLGIFFQALTQWLGFQNYGEEYKVMGLAPYGKPEYLNKMRDIVLLQRNGSFKLNLDYFRHHRENIEYEWNDCMPRVDTLFSESLIKLLGPMRQKDEPLTQYHKDVASSVQVMYEEAFLHLLKILHQKYNIDNLCLAGGCAQNSVANGKIYNKTSFKKVYVQSAPDDAGGAIGAAFSVWHKLGGKKNFVMEHAYWGPNFNNSHFKRLLHTHSDVLREQQCEIVNLKDENILCERTAMAIADGKVIGWFQGRMEWGPRALGNRSILCDPRRTDMKQILNKKIKKRESFRPFAPSVLRESVNDWFEQEDDVPFMMQVYQIREKKQALIPAVSHVDGSGRLQTVCKEANPLYHKLISVFRDLTGVPMVLNTSFNENEPIVCNPEGALACFLRTNMDVLILGKWFIKRGSIVQQ